MAVRKFTDASGITELWSKVKSYVPTNVSSFVNDAGYMTGMTILSYGNSTWQDFLTAYTANKVVYCRASSGSNPASGSQTRLAFMAYVDNATSPTNVEFQYYRSVNSHNNNQQGDQVYVYKLTSAGTWTVTVRENYTKIVAGGDLTSNYSSGVLTISASIPTYNSSTDTITVTNAEITGLTVGNSGIACSGDIECTGSGVIASLETNALLITSVDQEEDPAIVAINNSSILLDDNGIGTAIEAGAITLFDGSQYGISLVSDTLTDNQTIMLPDASGTIALTSDIPSIPSNNVTGSGTSGYIAKFNGANTITDGPAFGNSTTTFLRNDGTWAVPSSGSQFTSTTVTITAANWNSSTTCQKSVTGVTSSNDVIVSPAPSSIADYTAAGVYCSAQGSGTLTFTCTTTPTSSITVNVLIVG